MAKSWLLKKVQPQSLIFFPSDNLFLTAVFPSSLETIGRFAFDETSLTEVNFPNSLITLERGAFRRTDLTE